MTDVGVEGGCCVGGSKGGRGVGNGLSLLDGDSWETRANELFNLCDRESKGFITKRDLQRLWGELPLGPDELEGVFDSLDEDHNGFLSLEEFTDGFGRHLGLIVQFRADEEPLLTSGVAIEDENRSEDDDDATDLSKEQLDYLLDRLLEQDLESNSAVVEAVWRQVCGARTGVEEVEDGGEGGGGGGGGGSDISPSHGAGLGRLVVALMQELTRMKHEHTRLEAALAAKAEDYNKQVSKLYEELECQISGERSKVALEHSQKEARALASLENEVAEREAALRSLEDEQLKMRQRLEQVLAAETAARSENSFLSQHVEKLEADLNRRESEVQELQSALDALKHKTKEEKRRRAHQAFKVTEGIARERESLVTQLDLLRSINTQLRDEQDQAGGPHSHLRRRCREGGGGLGSSGSSSSASTPTSTNGMAGNSSVLSQLTTEGGVKVEMTPPTDTRPIPPNHLPLLPSPAHCLSLPPGAWSPSNRSSDCEHDEDYFNHVAIGVGPPMPPLESTTPIEQSLLKELLEQPVLCASCGGTNPDAIDTVGGKASTHALLHRKDSMTQTPSPSSASSPSRLPLTPAPRRIDSSSNTDSREKEKDEGEEEEEEKEESDTLEVGVDGRCLCERRDSQSSVSSQHSATILIYHPGRRSSSPDAHPPDAQHPPAVPAHPPLTRTPARHQKLPQSTPPRPRHSNLGVRFSDELEVQFFETGDGDGSSRVVRRQMVDLANASDVCSSTGGSGSECAAGQGGSKGSVSCGLSCEHDADGDGSSHDIGASNGLNKCVTGDCEDSSGSDSETGRGRGSSETPKSNGLSRDDGAGDCKPSSDEKQSDKDGENNSSSSRANDNTSNNDNKCNYSNGNDRNHHSNSRDEEDVTQPTRILNLQVLEPRMTQYLKLHYMRPVFTLEGRRFVSEGQEEALREEIEKERGRRDKQECYIRGSQECLVFHHSESQFSSFSALMGEDGRRVADSVDHNKEKNNNEVRGLGTSLNGKAELEEKAKEEEVIKKSEGRMAKPPPVPGPPRMFKVVLIGDSGVGKTSYIHRACTGEFRGDFGCTVGVDYRVLEVVVGGVRAVLQLWDTAGQERFRSITRQYYRKADGVVVMYDVTNEQSFISVNDWLTSVKETAGADVSVAVLGNKCDLAAARRVPKDIAYKMIRSHNCLMYEVSAASGNGVQESIKHLAALLATQQEHDLVTSTALDLHSEGKKKKYCCRE
ncbi:LOW QUALITY PROTEIN: uncharacterized protein LOC119595437 [Penaeus monodon]|uniref:LOW QUALITY PROTEIN: uncharacterized protein LOC119595437 n=1 Tax=Penaeus monodon TaxID=6687 RepID=UPI0018A7938B|nr:LOW QUALITY PROTEIN: uncharacterized protein LOC119595437 [Penaeus monodon]